MISPSCTVGSERCPWTYSFLALIFARLDALDAVGALLHDATHSHRDFGVEHHLLDQVDLFLLLLVRDAKPGLVVAAGSFEWKSK